MWIAISAASERESEKQLPRAAVVYRHFHKASQSALVVLVHPRTNLPWLGGLPEVLEGKGAWCISVSRKVFPSLHGKRLLAASCWAFHVVGQVSRFFDNFGPL